MSNTKLYVGGLPYSTSEGELEELFASYGQIESVRIITDRMTGRSRGFGFVEMSSEDECQQAIDALNDKDFNGRNLTVNKARPRENFGGGGHGGGGGYKSY